MDTQHSVLFEMEHANQRDTCGIYFLHGWQFTSCRRQLELTQTRQPFSFSPSKCKAFRFPSERCSIWTSCRQTRRYSARRLYFYLNLYGLWRTGTFSHDREGIPTILCCWSHDLMNRESVSHCFHFLSYVQYYFSSFLEGKIFKERQVNVCS